jgi:hypothetical protein
MRAYDPQNLWQVLFTCGGTVLHKVLIRSLIA